MSLYEQSKSRKYKVSSINPDLLKQLFGDLFYNRVEHDDKPIMFMLTGTDEENKKTLRKWRKIAKEGGKTITRSGKSNMYKINKNK